MRYLGGKSEIADELVELIVSRHSNRDLLIEPFCGGANMTRVFSQHFKEVRAYDIHPDLILMWQAVKDGWLPPDDISEQLYSDLRSSSPSALRGFTGFAGSFGGKWFGGYARGEGRNFMDETKRGFDVSLFTNVTFERKDFYKIEVPKNAIIYADPPYSGTTAYKATYSPIRFWFAVRKWAAAGATVYISEYKAPPDAVCVWEKKLNGNLKKKNNSTEKLFMLGDV